MFVGPPPPAWATRSRDGNLNKASALDQTSVGTGYNGVDLNGPNSFLDYQAFLARNPKPTVKESRPLAQLSPEETNNTKDNFISRWTGRVHAPKAGTYSVKIISDDWTMLLIDDKLAAACHNTTKEFTLTLKKGWQSFELAFGEIGGAATIEVEADPALKFAGPGDKSLPTYHRYDNASLEGGAPIQKYTLALHHQLENGTWEVTLTFSNLAETQNVNFHAEGKPVKTNITLPQHTPHRETFEVKVTDSALNLTFSNSSSAYNSIGVSSHQVKRVVP